MLEPRTFLAISCHELAQYNQNPAWACNAEAAYLMSTSLSLESVDEARERAQDSKSDVSASDDDDPGLLRRDFPNT